MTSHHGSRAPLLGVEQEFQLFAHGRKLDLRAFFERVIAPVRSVCFRHDRTSVILDAGYMFGCDVAEAEYATVPIAATGNGTRLLAAESRRCRAHMLGLLHRAGVDDVRGYSTHLSVSVPEGLEDAVAWTIVRTVGPALVLLLEAHTSPGLLVRPRRKRVEIVTEYTDDEAPLAAAAAFVAGAVQAFVRHGLAADGWPHVRVRRWEVGLARGGIFLPHDAYGESLHARGRDTRVRMRCGKRRTAGELLAQCAELCLEELGTSVDHDTAAELHRLARLGGVLQIERRDPVWHVARRPSDAGTPLTPLAGTLGAVATAHDVGATPLFVDWEGAAFRWTRAESAPVIGVPLGEIDRFLTLAATGDLSPLVGDLSSQSASLQSLEQLESVGVFAAIDAAALGRQASSDLGRRKKRPPPPPPDTVPCSAVLDGPDCVCIGRPAVYSVAATCPGHCENWAIDKDKVAGIVHIDDCEATVRVKKQGEFDISVDFIADNGETFHLSKHVHAYGVFHVLGETINSVVSTVPLIQPHPFVEIETPDETDDDECLGAGDYVVHTKAVRDAFALLHDPDPAKRTTLRDVERILTIELKVTGAITDFFKETDACWWSVVSDHGRRTTTGDLRKGVEFGDDWFRTRIPGEANVDEHVIVLTGVGEHDLRIGATNPIGSMGIDWITVTIGLKDSAQAAIAAAQRQLANHLKAGPGKNTPAAFAQLVAAATVALEKAYLDAVIDPCVEVAWNDQDAQSFDLTPADETRTQVRDGDDNRPPMITASVATVIETHPIDCKEENPELYLNEKPVRNYWVTQENYDGTLYKWEKHGMLLGRAGTPVVSHFECCDRATPIFGVEAYVPECVTVPEIDTPVTLTAVGTPPDVDGQPGLYRWTVIARPDAGADATIAPAGWTPKQSVELTVDTPGRYTVKVEYQLGGRICSLTYAVASIKIIATVRTALEWGVHRVGKYGAPFDEHIALPYYQERVPDPTRAAEMLIVPKPTKGKKKTPPIGRRFVGSFVIPPELEFDDGATLRAYFKPYSASLTAKDYADFTGPPYMTVTPGAPYQVVADITTRRDIHAIHLMDVRYKNSQRLKGQAVAISFAYQDPEQDTCPVYWIQATPDPSIPTGLAAQVMMLQDPDRTPPVTTDGTETGNPPLVNLILYNRDLGRPDASNAAYQLTSAGDRHNAANGNVYFELPVLQAFGHGIATALRLSYNSLDATYQDSLDFYQKLNEVTDKDVDRFWASNTVGKGWTHSYAMAVRYYVKPKDRDGKILEYFAEVVAPDGNRVQLRQAKGGADADGTYKPVVESDFWVGSSELGHSLELERSGDTSTLRARDKAEWRFDKGKLEELSTPLTRTTNTKPVKVSRANGKLVIKDSSGRETKIAMPPDAARHFSGPPLEIELPDDTKTTLTLGDGRLTRIDRKKIQIWNATYHDDVGQSDKNSLIKTLTDPLAVEAKYEFYKGDAFEGVPVEVARNFWGRLGKAEKGKDQVRAHRWFYEGFDPALQTLVYRNPRGIEFVLTLDAKRLALVSFAYIVKARDTDTGEIKPAPTYEPAKQNSAASTKTVAYSYEYESNTKLVTKSTDAMGFVTTNWYEPLPKQQGFRLYMVDDPDGFTRYIDYDPVTGLPSYMSPPATGTTKPAKESSWQYFYDPKTHQLKRVLHPTVTVDGVAAAGVEQTWNYEPASGKLTDHTDLNGVKWTFGYGEGGRDPYKSGLPTSRSVTLSKLSQWLADLAKAVSGSTTGKKRPRTWRTTYDRLGRAVETFEPFFGEVRKIGFHALGEVETTEQQPILTAAGAVEAMRTVATYDAMLRKTAETMPTGTLAWAPTEHGQAKTTTDAAGNVTTLTYHETGEIKTRTNAGAGTTYFDYDEAGRVILKRLPKPDARTTPDTSDAFAITLEYDDTGKRIVSRRRKLDVTNNKLGDPLHENIDKFREGRLYERRINHLPGATFEKVGLRYDKWGKVSSTSWHDGDTFIRETTIDRDEWGRDIGETHAAQGNEARFVKVVYYHDGKVKLERHRRGAEASGPSYEYDEVGRVLGVRDAYDTVVQAVHYKDFGNDPDDKKAVPGATEWKQDPSADVGKGRLIFSRMMGFNRRGLMTWFRDDPAGVAPGAHYLRYDVSGRVVEEKETDGATMYYTLDAYGRPLKTERERDVQKPGSPMRDLILDRDHTIVKERVTVREATYAWNGELASTTERGVTFRQQYDTHGRLIRTLRDATGDDETQALFYDALDRIKRRVLPGSMKQAFTYDDTNRTVVSHFESSGVDVRTRTTLDWQGFVKKYVIEQYALGLPVSMAKYQSPVQLEYDYYALGDLKEKRYLNPAGTLLASITYTSYTPSGLPLEQHVALHKPDSHASIEFTRNFAYDRNDRLRRLDSANNAALHSGEKRIFGFVYNDAGFLEQYDRPHWNDAKKSFEYGVRTIFAHDTMGRVTTINDHTRTGSSLAALNCLYDKPRDTFLDGAHLPLDLLDLGPAKSLKAVRYMINDPVTMVPIVFARDMARDGDGDVRTWVTAAGDIRGLREDWRTVETKTLVEGMSLSHRRYRTKLGTPGKTEEYNYTLQTRTGPSGVVRDTFGRRNTRTPFDDFIGNIPPDQSPDGRKQTFREQRVVDGTSKWPRSATLVVEDTAGYSSDSGVPYGREFEKDFYHDAAGRLAAASQKEVPRMGQGADFLSSPGQGEESIPNHVVHYLGPDGEEIAQATYMDGHDDPATVKIRVTDGDTLVAELSASIFFTFYETLPGAGTRLGATAGQFLGGPSTPPSIATLTGEVLYHWDEAGATSYLTDAVGNVAAVYGLLGPDGQTDLFGEPPDPVAWHVVHSRVIFQMITSAGELFDVASMPLDVAVTKVASMHHRNDQVLALSADPTHVAPGANDYNALLSPFSYAKTTPTTAQWILQGILDTVRGIGEAVSFGYASKGRAALWDHDEEMVAVRNPYAFGGGYVAGIVISFYIGNVGSGLMAGRTVATLATRVALLYSIISDVNTFVTSMRAILAGKGGFLDYLSIAIPFGYAGSLRGLRGRNAKLAEAIELAGNAPSLRDLVLENNVIKGAFKLTAKMRTDPRLLGDLFKYAGLAAYSAGRNKTLAFLKQEFGITEIILSEAQRALMAEKLGVMPPAVMTTVGEVDAYLRAVWRRVHNATSDLHAGHRLDLAYNDIQARWEPRAFLMMVEFVEKGRVDAARTLVGNLFNFHRATANLSSGSSLARGIAGFGRAQEELAEGTAVVLRLLTH